MSHLVVLAVSAALLTLLLSASDVAAGDEIRVRVDAGKVDRRDALVAVELPAGGGGGGGGGGGTGGATPSRRWLKVTLGAGESATYALPRDAETPVHEPMHIQADGHDAFRIAAGDREVLTYRGGAGVLPKGYDESLRRGGYVQSVHSPAGVLVTDDYPPGHKHHHGIWSPWTKTEFEGRRPDFWNMGDRTGTVSAIRARVSEAGPLAAGLQATHRMVDLSAGPNPVPALDEHWSLLAFTSTMKTAGSTRPCNVIDLGITQTCATASPLILPEYHYGGLGFRGHRQWDGAGRCRYLTSEGKTVSDGNATRARWCYVGGLVDGKPAGVAILCHPANFRFPQPVRLHPKEPFFCFALSQLGEWRIEPGKPYVARYRFVVADGDPDPAEIERLWRDYAEPVGVLLVSQ
jgi:hypothetical protein